jgi:hypothetical protein
MIDSVSGFAPRRSPGSPGHGLATGATLNYAANQDGTGGTLSVSDGARTANIVMLGQ